MAEKSQYGCLYGVGVGPGDPELVTLKALRVLQRVPVIFVPQAKGSRESIALSIAQPYLDPARQEIERFPFPTDDAAAAEAAWPLVTDAVARRLEQGQDVAFPTEGDPMLYGSFCYVLAGLTERYPHLPVEVIPGVSSVLAAAARAKTPLVTHSQRLAILPAFYGVADLKETLQKFDTVILMKVNPPALRALAELQAEGLACKGVYARRVSTPREQVVCGLRNLSVEHVDYFSMVIIQR